MSYSVVVNDYIGAIKRNMPHETTNYGPGKYNRLSHTDILYSIKIGSYTRWIGEIRSRSNI